WLPRARPEAPASAPLNAFDVSGSPRPVRRLAVREPHFVADRLALVPLRVPVREDVVVAFLVAQRLSLVALGQRVNVRVGVDIAPAQAVRVAVAHDHQVGGRLDAASLSPSYCGPVRPTATVPGAMFGM